MILLTVILVVYITQCGGDKGKKTKRESKIELSAAGATFPYPLYSKMFKIYYDKTGVKVNYQAIGSGGGIRQLKNQTVDFGGTDAYMSNEELGQIEGDILHLPTCIGAVAVSYNLPDNPRIRLTPELLAGIFLGKITRWDDVKILAVNKHLDLPDKDITVIHRSDGSGTTFVFSDYLAKVSTEWKTKVGAGKSLRWPVGLGGKGNPGVAGLIKQVPGSIGYVELIYAEQNDLPVIELQNRSGNYISPDLESTTLAGQVIIPSDTRVYITDTDADQGYPVSSLTWLIFYKKQNYGNHTLEEAQAMANLFWWMIHAGQEYPEKLGYASLPQAAVKKAEAIIHKMTYDGKPLLKK